MLILDDLTDASLRPCSSIFYRSSTSFAFAQEPDKQRLTSVNCLGESVNSMPYAQISSVDESRDCFCCRSVNGMMPGCGCSGPLVTEVATELQQRRYDAVNGCKIGFEM